MANKRAIVVDLTDGVVDLTRRDESSPEKVARILAAKEKKKAKAAKLAEEKAKLDEYYRNHPNPWQELMDSGIVTAVGHFTVRRRPKDQVPSFA